jgi:hypothetical protein
MALGLADETGLINKDDGSKTPLLYSPYLWLPYDASDKGVRPLAPGTQFWESPYILISPTDASGNVRVGTDVQIRAVVINGGLGPAVPVVVSFHWANPALALTPPWQFIGSKIVAVPPGPCSITVDCPVLWRPTFVNGGHECVIVTCTSPVDHESDPLSPAVDRYTAQRNVTVTNNEVLQPLQLQLDNPFQVAREFTLRLSSARIQGNLSDLRSSGVTAALSSLGSTRSEEKDPGVVSGENPEIDVRDITSYEFGVHVVAVKHAKRKRRGYVERVLDLEQYLQARAAANPDFDAASLGTVLRNIALAPATSCIVDIEFPRVDLQHGELLVHRITQVVEGCDIGGYSVFVTPEYSVGRGEYIEHSSRERAAPAAPIIEITVGAAVIRVPSNADPGKLEEVLRAVKTTMM